MQKQMTRDEMLGFLEWGAKVLALPYDAQVAFYGDAEGITEDLIDQWGDGVLYLGIAGGETAEQRQAVNRIEDALTAIDDPDSAFWLNAALRESDGWQQIRAMAKEVLKAFGWNEGPPDDSLRMVHFITVDGPTGQAI
jgi:hypothetical protein